MKNTSVVTNGGSNVNIVIKIASKLTVFVVLTSLVGCASAGGLQITVPPQPAVVYVPPYQAMDLFKPDCANAKLQIETLERKLVEYQQYHEYYPYTDADAKYYRQLKNNLWGLRSTCATQ